MPVADFDWNLIKILDALFRHGNVSRAAVELGLTQSAVSHALARAREHFGDPLHAWFRAMVREALGAPARSSR